MSRMMFYKNVPDDLVIARYMDFTKFVDLCTRKALYFHPLPLLRKIEPYENRLPLALAIKMKSNIENSYTKENDSFFKNRALRRINNPSNFDYAANCWTIWKNESDAMWKSFAPSNTGLLIKSSFRELKSSILDKNRLIIAGPIDYINHFTDLEFKKSDTSLGFEDLFNKAEYFRAEEEFRLYIEPEIPIGIEYTIPEIYNNQEVNKSLYLDVDIKTLITEIIISPRADDWFKKIFDKYVEQYLSKDIIKDSIVLRADLLDI